MQMLFRNSNIVRFADKRCGARLVGRNAKMLHAALALWVIVAIVSTLSAQGQAGDSIAGAGATPLNSSTNLPVEHIGPNDLIGLSVYDSPELTRTFRVDSDGTLRLPMLHKHIQAAGLYPEQLENSIRTALINGGIFVDPIVTVTVVEYRSRPISVVGAVRNPITFQDTGNLTLLDAISQAGGLTDNAGQEILVSRQQMDSKGKTTTLTQRIPTHELFSSADSSPIACSA